VYRDTAMLSVAPVQARLISTDDTAVAVSGAGAEGGVVSLMIARSLNPLSSSVHPGTQMTICRVRNPGPRYLNAPAVRRTGRPTPDDKLRCFLTSMNQSPLLTNVPRPPSSPMRGGPDVRPRFPLSKWLPNSIYAPPYPPNACSNLAAPTHDKGGRRGGRYTSRAVSVLGSD